MIVVKMIDESTEDHVVYQTNHKGNIKVYAARPDVLNAFNASSENSLEKYDRAVIMELTKKEVKHGNRANRTREEVPQ